MMEFASAEIEDTKAETFRNKMLAYVELTKPRIAFMLVLTAAAGFFVGSNQSLNYVLFANAMIGIALLAFGVATLNQWLERHTDRLMKRTAGRPLPAGRLGSAEALIFGILQCTVAEIYLAVLVNPLTAFLGLIVIVGYVLLYTPLKTRTTISTAIGAIPGAMPPLMGWTSAANEISIGAWSLFVLLFLWQFPHFFAIAWIYKEDYSRAGILMLPVVEADGKLTARQIVLFSIMLVPVSFAPFFFGFAGPIYLAGAAVLGLWFLFESFRAARGRTAEKAKRLMFVTILYLPLIFGLLVADCR